MIKKSTEDYFHLRDVGTRLSDLETPVPVIDLDVVEHNVGRWQERCDTLGLVNRPHIKTHKLAGLAQYQLDSGAKGITVQKVGEAECMAKAGIRDMLLTFNIVGRPKLERLARLIATTEIKVVADNTEILDGLGWAAQNGGRELGVLVECDTGMHRNGVVSPVAARELAIRIEQTPGLRFGGLMTYPAAGLRVACQAILHEASALCKVVGLDARIVSSGGSPDMFMDEGLEGVTEYRSGTYIYFDRSMVHRGTCTFDECALTVLATVVSCPAPERAIIDAGTKALTSDLLGLTGFGIVRGLDDAVVTNANEEHGFLDVAKLARKPCVGDLVRVLPNHVCPVSNLFDEVVLVRGERVIGATKVDARGLVQ